MAALVLLAVLVVVAWRFGPDVADRVADRFQEPGDGAVSPSPELADASLERFRAVMDGRREDASFTAAELESILRYRLEEEFPTGVVDPRIRFRDGEVVLGVHVPLERLPSIPEVERLRGVLPEILPVEFRGALLTLPGGEAAIVIRRIEVAGIPIPRAMHAAIAAELQSTRPPGLPPESLSFALPSGLESVHLEAGRLHVTGAR